MKRLLLPLIAALALPTAALALPTAANAAKRDPIYLSCDYGEKNNLLQEITINPGKEFGTVSWIVAGTGKEVSKKAQQFVSSDSYKLKSVDAGRFGFTRTWAISRTDGSITQKVVFTVNDTNEPPIYASGKCKKIKRVKTLF